MKLYLDDNSADPALVGILRKAGHQAVFPDEVGMSGATDPRHLEYAIRHGLALVTADRDDFLDLHDLILASGGAHPGVLLMHFENNSKRDMKPHHVAAAINRLERSGIGTQSQLIVMNHWR